MNKKMAFMQRGLAKNTLLMGTGKWMLLGAIIGIACGIIGVLFVLATQTGAHYLLGEAAGFVPKHPAGEKLFFHGHGGGFSWWALLLIMGAGGIAVGLIVKKFAKDTAGAAGTEAAVTCFHQKNGFMRLGAWVSQLFCAIITLSTGGSAGREGPIIMVGAGSGGWLSKRFNLSSRDRRILVIAGMAGGIAGVFRAPLAGALFAAEVLYIESEFETDALIPSFISAIVSYCVFGLFETSCFIFLGGDTSVTESLHSSLFLIPEGLNFQSTDFLSLIGYAIVAIIAMLFSRSFVKIAATTEHLFGKLKIKDCIKPGIGAICAGGFALGLLGILSSTGVVGNGDMSPLSVLGAGYGMLQNAFDTSANDPTGVILWPVVILLSSIAFIKMFTTSLTISSGGSGGFFGPSMVIGGCVGGAVGFMLQGMAIAPHPAACVIMGMCSFLAAHYKTPLAALLMVSEITGDYKLLLPAMWVCSIGFLTSGKKGIVVTQVLNQLHSTAHKGHFFSDVLADIKVSEVFDLEREIRTLKPSSSINECKQVVTECEQYVYPLLNKKTELVGLFTLDDLRTFLYDEELAMVAIAEDVATTDLLSVTLEDSLTTTMNRFTMKNLDELPVVCRNTNKFLGLLSRRDVVDYYNKMVDKIKEKRKEEGYEDVARARGLTHE